MTDTNQTSPQTGEPVFVLTRTFDAPCDLVFKASTDPEHLQHWFGPKDCSFTLKKLQLRPDGLFHYRMVFPNDNEKFGRFIYREIVEPEKLEVIEAFCDEEANIVPHPFVPGYPIQAVQSFTFNENDGKTTITTRVTPYEASEAEVNTFVACFDKIPKGWNGTYDKFEEYLAALTKA